MIIWSFSKKKKKTKSLDGRITQQIGQTLFLYKLTMQNIEVLFCKHCKVGAYIAIYFWKNKKQQKKQQKPKNMFF